MFQIKFEEYMCDIYVRLGLYRIELEENNVGKNNTDDLIQLCIESNFHLIHDLFSKENYQEYQEWINENLNKNNLYINWLNKIKKEDDERHLVRYNKIARRN
jgi:hypothetical protein